MSNFLIGIGETFLIEDNNLDIETIQITDVTPNTIVFIDNNGKYHRKKVYLDEFNNNMIKMTKNNHFVLDTHDDE